MASASVAAEPPACDYKLEAMGALSELWNKSAVAPRDPLLLIETLEKKFPGQIGIPGSGLRHGLGRVLRKVLGERVEAAKFLSADKKSELLESLDQAIRAFQGDVPDVANFGHGGGQGGGGGEEPPLNSFSDELPKPDPRIIAEIDAYFERPSFQTCAGETALLLGISSLVSALGAVVVNWEKFSPVGNKSFWTFLKKDLFTKAVWKKAWADPEFTHLMTWNSILMTSLGALSCMGDKNAGRNAMTAISLGASLFDQWRAGEFSLRQTVVDTLWIRYVSFFKTGKALHYSRAYAATGRAYPKLVEGALQTTSELIGAFGYPLTNLFSKRVWERGEGYFTDAEALWRGPLARRAVHP